MTRTLLLVGVALGLMACSPPANNTGTPSSAPAAATSAGGNMIQPGQYRTTVTILSLTAPGVPQAQIQQMLAQPMTDEDCVTNSDVNEMTRKSLVDADEGETCTENRVNAVGGHIEGSATCTSADGEKRTMQVTGSFSATHLEMDAVMSGQTPAGPMSQHVRMTSDRIGECPAGGATP